jgi:hypothetical protein
MDGNKLQQSNNGTDTDSVERGEENDSFRQLLFCSHKTLFNNAH